MWRIYQVLLLRSGVIWRSAVGVRVWAPSLLNARCGDIGGFSELAKAGDRLMIDELMIQ